MKKFFYILVFVLAGCHHYEYDDVFFNFRDRFIGKWCGVKIIDGNSYPFDTRISKSTDDSMKVIISNFLYGRPIEAIVSRNKLIIPKVIYMEEGTPIEIWGDGTFDQMSSHLQIDFSLKILPDIAYTGRIDLYPPSATSYTGTYTDDTVTMVISPIGDLINIDLIFPEYWVPSGFIGITTKNESCCLNLTSDSIIDIGSGEYYELMGSACKTEDTLNIYLNAYYHGISPLYIYHLLLVKQNNWLILE